MKIQELFDRLRIALSGEDRKNELVAEARTLIDECHQIFTALVVKHNEEKSDTNVSLFVGNIAREATPKGGAHGGDEWRFFVISDFWILSAYAHSGCVDFFRF